MAIITEHDRKKEFEHIKEFLDALDVAADIAETGADQGQTCLLISLPTEIENWKEEYQTDLHLATGYLFQLSDDEDQLTKYLMLYMPVKVDLRDVDELELLRLVNELNRKMRIGTCFYGTEENTGRVLLQVKWLIGGRVDVFLDEGVVCEAVFELGALYDQLKEQLAGLEGNRHERDRTDTGME